MSVLGKVLGNMAAGTVRALNDKYAGEAALKSAKAKARKKGGDTGCSPCKARAMQHQIQQGLGVKGWYKV